MPIFIETLKKIKPIDIKIIIVGSRKLSSDENSTWSIFTPNLTIYGFDLDKTACNSANKEFEQKRLNWTEKHIPKALSHYNGKAELYITKSTHCSSLYRPNKTFLDRITGMENGFKLDAIKEIEVTTIDDFCQSEHVEAIDFLQIDVQGADLDVLKGAAKLLERSVWGIQIEVEFSPLYVNQPLFSDIDIYLRNQGFTLFDLITKDNWCRLPRSCSPVYSAAKKGQLLWADAFYLRDPLINNAHPVMTNPKAIFKLACLADAFDYYDYALELLKYLTINYGNVKEYNFASIIIDTLSRIPQFSEKGIIDNLPVVTRLKPFLKIKES